MPSITRIILQSVIIVLISVLSPGKAMSQSTDGLAKFMPDETDFVLAIQPQRLFGDLAARTILNPERLYQFVPEKVGVIDSIYVAGSWNKSMDLFRSSANHQSRVFKPIANDLSGQSPTPKREPSCAEQFNSDLVVLMRFRDPISDEQIIDWLSDNGRYSFFSSTRNGKTVIACDDKKTCQVVRLDAVSIVVGNREAIDKGIKGIPSKAGLAIKIDQLSFARDFSLTLDFAQMNHASTAKGILVGIPGVLSFEEVSIAIIELDFSGPKLFVGTFNVNDREAAAKLEKSVSNFWQEQIGMYRHFAATQANNLSLTREQWMIKTIVDIAESMTIDGQDNTVSISVPRPAGWDEMVEKYVEHTRLLAQEAEAQFNELSKQLDTDMEAATEALRNVRFE